MGLPRLNRRSFLRSAAAAIVAGGASKPRARRLRPLREGGDDYRRRLAARSALGQAIVRVMDDNRLDAIAYPTTRRIAPLLGSNQTGSNAGLSEQTGFPAITVP